MSYTVLISGLVQLPRLWSVPHLKLEGRTVFDRDQSRDFSIGTTVCTHLKTYFIHYFHFLNVKSGLISERMTVFFSSCMIEFNL